MDLVDRYRQRQSQLAYERTIDLLGLEAVIAPYANHVSQVPSMPTQRKPEDQAQPVRT